MQLENSTAIVTGASSGLGRATALRLAAHGMSVVGTDRLESEPGDGITSFIADVTDEDDVRAALALVDPARPLHLAVNCAGIAPVRSIFGDRGPHDLALFRTTVEVNLVGTFNVLRLAAEVMAGNDPDEDGQRGLVVNTASIAAFEGQVGQVAYAASKAGVMGMTIAAARDLAGFGIRVNTIAPGLVNTPMLAQLGEEALGMLSGSVPFPSRLASPDEFAQLVVMLAEHDYLNGETIRMDGALRLG